MNQFDPRAKEWLSEVLGVPFRATKHIHSNQDEVYKIEASSNNYYLKISKALGAERDNLKKLENILNVPKVIDFYDAGERDYLLISELPGKNLVELIKEWPDLSIVDKFAQAIKELHNVDIAMVFPKASPADVLLHGDMALPNIIMTDQGHIGYIDVGQMSFGSPDSDLADAIWSLQRNIGSGYGQLFLEKYGQVAMTPKIKEALEFRYEQPS